MERQISNVANMEATGFSPASHNIIIVLISTLQIITKAVYPVFLN